MPSSIDQSKADIIYDVLLTHKYGKIALRKYINLFKHKIRA